MTGATPVTFSGQTPQPITSGVISFPNGFTFHYGLKSYSTFAVSTFGFIRLGNDLISNTPESQDEVIVPICNGTAWNSRYKITGVAPNRKMIIEWNASMQPTGEPTKFQLWLSERIGKIEFVYQSIGGFYGFPALWNYKVFCKASIMEQPAVASIPVVANNTIPVVNYSSVIACHDSIYPKTHYILQPDTVRPAGPASIGFANIMSGCLNVQINDNSINESLFQLERSDDNTNFFLEKKIFVASPANTGIVTYNQTGLQPFWNYRYRVFASNGFLNSDTITSNPVQSLMPQISGVKQIPGDYPSITALIQDAACKHLGPDLVIELQNNYSIASETLPITIPKNVQTRLINSITIRPAANATINWTATTNTTIFFVDSVKHVILDGRPGGIGTSRNFTIFQQKEQGKAIQYYNAADSGAVKYCNVLLKNSPTNLFSNAIVIGPKDSTNSLTRKNVNYFTLSNSFISADNLSVVDLVSIKSTDSTGSKGLRIENNEFSRFVRDAIYIENGAENASISGNKFYQPVSITPIAFLPINSASCIKLVNLEKIRISNNFFGGGSATWGQGRYAFNGAVEYNFIHYQNTSATKQAEFVSNQFGNIHSTSIADFKMIYATGGEIRIDSNRIGTTDSLYSITSKGKFWGFDLWYGKKYVLNNFFSGMHGQYPNISDIAESYFISTGSVDSVNISNNDIGGSNNYNSNTTYGPIHPIYGGYTDSIVVIRGNWIRGMSSRRSSVSGISYNHALTNKSTYLTIDSNSIHHIKAAKDVIGIDGLARVQTICRISNNNIYALYSSGEVMGPSYPVGNLKGISFTLHEYPYQTGTLTTPELHIYGNRVHSLIPLRVQSDSRFYLTGISGASGKNNVWNNDVRLGLDALGQPIDSGYTYVTGMVVSGVPNRVTSVEHNSIFIGGRGNIQTALNVSSATSTTGQKTVFVTNNIIHVDRNIPDNNYPAYYSFQYTLGNSLVSAKNLWYSNILPNISAALDSYKQACSCDSSSFTGNPMFVNPTGDSASYDLHLAAGSKADSAGTVPVLPINTDIDGSIRNNYSPVDIGSHVASSCNGGALPSLNIATIGDTIFMCSTSSAIITASITGGSFQQLQWQRNLNDITGANSASLVVTSPGLYRLIGKKPCVQVASRTIVVVNSSTNNAQPSVSISASSTTICAGVSVTFTASPTNPGSAPNYQWQVNGVNAGTNSPVFTTTSLTNNAQVKVLLTNTTTCNPNSTAASNTITMTVNPIVVPNITIDGPFFVVQGQSNTYVSFTSNSGSTPSFLWEDSTNLHNWQAINNGTQSSLSYTPALTGNKLRCRMTSTANCANPTVVYSPPITFTVNISTGVGSVPADFGIQIFPNPVRNKLIIDKLKLNDKWQNATINSIDGKRKLITRSLSNRTSIEIELGQLPAGIYVLALNKKSGEGVKQKFIKL